MVDKCTFYSNKLLLDFEKKQTQNNSRYCFINKQWIIIIQKCEGRMCNFASLVKNISSMLLDVENSKIMEKQSRFQVLYLFKR